MKKLFVLLTSVLLLSACSNMSRQKKTPPPAPVRAAPAPKAGDDFRAGISSATVENLAKQQSCKGGFGASLVTPAGPVEEYRMKCDDGRVFKARCELRQCKAM